MLRTRVATALLLAPIALALVVFLPPPLIWYPLAPLFGLAAWEWGRLADDATPALAVAFGVLTGLAVALLLPRLGAETAVALCGAGTVGWVGLAAWLWRTDIARTGGRMPPPLKLISGVPVLLIGALAVGTVFNLEAGRGWLLALLLVIWGADTGAYFTGKRFGRHKLAPAISPGKTWEGVFGGLLVVALVALLAGHLSGVTLGQRLGLLGVALLAAVLSIVGDLFASLLKRQAGRKDSSSLLPGHGGILDRCDSLLAAAPTFSAGLALLGIQR